MCGLTAGEQLVDPGMTALVVGNGERSMERSQSGVGGNAVRPVQWYGTSPITLRPGKVSIPRGGPPVSVDRLGIFWRVGLFSHSRLRAALHVIQSLRTPSYLLHTDSTVLRDGAIPPWMRVFLGGRDSRYHTHLRARVLRRVSASRRVARCRYARARVREKRSVQMSSIPCN